MDTKQKPSIGRIVHFVQNNVHYAAIILKVWSDTCVNLHVFHSKDSSPVPGSLDKQDNAYSVTYAAVCPMCGKPDWSWHWPEQV